MRIEGFTEACLPLICGYFVLGITWNAAKIKGSSAVSHQMVSNLELEASYMGKYGCFLLINVLDVFEKARLVGGGKYLGACGEFVAMF